MFARLWNVWVCVSSALRVRAAVRNWLKCTFHRRFLRYRLIDPELGCCDHIKAQGKPFVSRLIKCPILSSLFKHLFLKPEKLCEADLVYSSGLVLYHTGRSPSPCLFVCLHVCGKCVYTVKDGSVFVCLHVCGKCVSTVKDGSTTKPDRRNVSSRRKYYIKNHNESHMQHTATCTLSQIPGWKKQTKLGFETAGSWLTSSDQLHTQLNGLTSSSYVLKQLLACISSWSLLDFTPG